MRRFLQFRLSTVLMFVALCAMALGWWKDHHDLRGKVNAFNVEMDERIGAVLQATDPAEASVAYRNLFAVAGSVGLRRLIFGRHDGIAIQATWERLSQALPEDEQPASGIDPLWLEEFLLCVEDRARVKVPEWWQAIVRGARLDQRNRIAVDVPSLTPAGSVGPLNTPDRFYVPVHDGWGAPYELTCEDRASAKTLWKAQVWAVNWKRGDRIGWSNGPITVIQQGGRVVVFGAAPDGVYLEVFRADDGSNLFRFSSAY